ncbi:4-phosphoerythronate dehydrogenase [Psychromonas sp. RZ22]|uniref:4-phosphoerythronate dehydrogenase n=1 Tax=Psychromonas algarum TaxID=2555643 RepID=UPI001067DA93|nr:4-phosphoerythronate dehydrogenase [Psychromonas sp. RZ22]TEW55186.1 4-phosphoerythronate dehydrogenase [Psychromonas sp. RZ22]
MKIYIDENIPYGKSFFKGFGEVVQFSGRDVTAEQVKDADVLLVRSITKVDQSLLALNKKIKFVGTATIGIDHIDIEYLKQKNIQFNSAPGCNKVSVAEYVLSALLVLAEKKQFQLTNKTVAIVGAGNTGTAVYQCLTAIGVTCKLYDPPLNAVGDQREFCDFSEVLSADIISLHVPKIITGPFKTLHMFDEHVLNQLTDKQILINACRGEVIDNQALLKTVKKENCPTLVLDVWEKEPNIEKLLLPYIALATPHIAGYSLDGKVRGTEMLYQALCKYLNMTPMLNSTDFMAKPNISEITITSSFTLELLKPLVHLIYDVRRDDALFRIKVNESNGFDNMRKNYQERRELSTLMLNMTTSEVNHLSTTDLSQVGFTVNNI